MNLNRVFHCKPSILVVFLFLETPIWRIHESRLPSRLRLLRIFFRSSFSAFGKRSHTPSLKLTASSHPKMDGWNTRPFPFGMAYFQVRAVSSGPHFPATALLVDPAMSNILLGSRMIKVHHPPLVWWLKVEFVFFSKFGATLAIFTRWWLNQPIWNICSSNWIISPICGVKIQKSLKPPPSLSLKNPQQNPWKHGDFFFKRCSTGRLEKNKAKLHALRGNPSKLSCFASSLIPPNWVPFNAPCPTKTAFHDNKFPFAKVPKPCLALKVLILPCGVFLGDFDDSKMVTKLLGTAACWTLDLDVCGALIFVGAWNISLSQHRQDDVFVLSLHNQLFGDLEVGSL